VTAIAGESEFQSSECDRWRSAKQSGETFWFEQVAQDSKNRNRDCSDEEANENDFPRTPWSEQDLSPHKFGSTSACRRAAIEDSSSPFSEPAPALSCEGP
jgi:hypothetical protein